MPIFASSQPPAPKPPTAAQILEALKRVKDPELGHDVVSLGMIEGLTVQDGVVSFSFVLTTPACPVRSQFEQEVRDTVTSLPGVKDVVMKVDAKVRGGGRAQNTDLVPGVRNIVAVASGKGGVGKTTVSVNLAVALAQSGARVGLLDADIYGPNVPLMMGVETLPQPTDNKLPAVINYQVKFMSMGFFLSEGNPVVWRGPMIHGAIQQMLRDVDWGELDYMVVDLPPGTGDASLSLAQLVPLTGAVIVITPQDVAIQDGAKAMGMFRKLNVPILGLVENMSYFICPHCEGDVDIFGRGGGKSACQKYKVDFLGEIPLDPRVREGGDQGRPITITYPDSVPAAKFRELAGVLAGKISVLTASGASGTPIITFTSGVPR